MNADVEQVAAEVTAALDVLRQCWKEPDRVRLTFYARIPGEAESDMLLTDETDARGLLMGLVGRVLEEETKIESSSGGPKGPGETPGVPGG